MKRAAPERETFIRCAQGLFRPQRSCDRRAHLGRIRLGASLEALKHHAIATDEKFSEVPSDIARKRRVLSRERAVERVPLRTIYLDFSKSGNVT